MRGLTILGLFGLIDPPREAAVAAVRNCREAGISVKMITGDHALTTVAIGEQIGMVTTGGGVTGNMPEKMDDDQLGLQWVPSLSSSGTVFRVKIWRWPVSLQ